MVRSCLAALMPIALVLLCAACQPPLVAAPHSAATAASTETPHTAIRLPSLPRDEAISVRPGQRLILPTRTPSENWQLDYDPRYWQRADGDQPELIAIASGETEVVQRERPGHGGPAPRRFVYRLRISP
ncbi:MAG: hypothetical protein ACOY3E_12585 [Pseudomonadota bacterium]